MSRLVRVLNLGAGVGSTTVFLLARFGLIEPVDAAIMADTGEEPQPVYEHLSWLQSLGSPRVIVTSRGKLGDDLVAGRIAAGNGRSSGRFTSIPAYTGPAERDEAPSSCEIGMIQRQCTRDYKVDPVWQAVRRELLGLKSRQRVPAGTVVTQLFGLDDGEAGRIARVKERFRKEKHSRPEFPLARLGWSRENCRAFLAKHVPHEVPRSACVFCPFRRASEWVWLMDHDPAGFARAVEIDRAIRDPSFVCTRDLKQALYLHKRAVPLETIDLRAEAALEAARPKQLDLFSHLDCGTGMCGA
jgi:hypothetical protein